MSTRRSTPRIGAIALTITVIAGGSCTGGTAERVEASDSAMSNLGPADRTIAVVTTACGSSSASIGSAVGLDDTTVLTAAHVVAGARSVAVVGGDDLPADRRWPDFSPTSLFADATPFTVTAFDPVRDLALLTADPNPVHPAGELEGDRPELGTLTAGEPVEIHGASAPAVDGTVALRTTIEADEVRGERRVERDGYRLDATTGPGDSGAGVWSSDGRLVGLVFAVSVGDDTRTWAVSGHEIESFLAAAQRGPAPSYRCDETTGRLVAEP